MKKKLFCSLCGKEITEGKEVKIQDKTMLVCEECTSKTNITSVNGKMYITNTLGIEIKDAQ